MAGLKMAAFGPFVPRIDENKVFLPGRRHEVPDRVGQPAPVNLRRGIDEDGGVAFAAGGVVPHGGDAAVAEVIGAGLGAHGLDERAVI